MTTALPFFARCIAAALLCAPIAVAGNLGGTPYRGWSSWSLQATTADGYGRDWLTAERVLAQADAMHNSLGSHGYIYVNIDSFWSDGFDKMGRPIANPKTFPEGIASLAAKLHERGQKLGLYTVPGVDDRVVAANPLIEGTTIRVSEIVFHPKRPANAFRGGWAIDYSKRGAQEYIDSIARQFADWGIDLLKLDGMVPGSDYADTDIDTRADAAAWSAALPKTGRPIWLTLSWKLDRRHADEWRNLAHAWRVNGDVERYGPTLSGWEQVKRRFAEQPAWDGESGQGRGWCDLDSLPVASGDLDGLTSQEKQTAFTFWVLCCSPLYVGGDLTKLDQTGLRLLTNKDLLAFNQAGRPAKQLTGGDTPVWFARQADGSVMAGLFNLSDQERPVGLDLESIGIKEELAAHDVWENAELGPIGTRLELVLPPHTTRLILLRAARP